MQENKLELSKVLLLEDQQRMIFSWVKENKINFKEFKELIHFINDLN